MLYIRISSSRICYLDNNGIPAVGYKVYTCTPGTSTLEQTWSDKDLTALNTNPIVLDARGQGVIFSDSSRKLILCLPTSTGPTDGVIQSDDYLGEETGAISDIATTTPGTTDNNYVCYTVPPYLTLPDGFLLEFKPDVDSTDTISPVPPLPPNHGGIGINDCVIRGPYTGTTPGTFTITIDATGTPDTVSISKSSVVLSTGVAITPGVWQSAIEGIQFRFSESTGHTLGNTWTVSVITPAHVNFCGLGNWIVYKNTDLGQKALSKGDFLQDFWALLTKSGTSWILNNPATQTGSVTDASTGTRVRKQENGDYTLLTDDRGGLIDFANTTTANLYLGPASSYNEMFYYIRAGGTGDVLITTSYSEIIKSEEAPLGATTYLIKGRQGKTIQLQCNGVSWEVLMEPPVDITYKFITYAMSPYSYTPTAGRRWVIAIPQGAGGGGSSNNSSGYGGAAGGKAIKAIDTTGLSTPITVTIGYRGAGGVLGGYPGNPGGTTSFGTQCSATGGSGGGDGAGTPGTGIDGDIDLVGNDGAAGGAGGLPSNPFSDAPYGGGGAQTNPGTAGQDGACWIIEIPEYLSPLIPMIYQNFNLWYKVCP